VRTSNLTEDHVIQRTDPIKSKIVSNNKAIGYKPVLQYNGCRPAFPCEKEQYIDVKMSRRFKL
jgi:hypothetical protein